LKNTLKKISFVVCLLACDDRKPQNSKEKVWKELIW